jgi:hypothetical protein
MTVQTRLNRRAASLRVRRSSRDPHEFARSVDVHAELIRAREAGRSQDEALYRCGCGFVFQAPVSTSVGCPHCGGKQAW